MQDQPKKLQKFKTAVFAEVDQKVASMEREVEAERSKVLSEYEATLKLAMEELLSKELAKVERSERLEQSKAEVESYRAGLLEREEMIERVLGGVRAALEVFTKGSGYGEYLGRAVKEFYARYPLSGVTFYVRGSDLIYADIMESAAQGAGYSCEVKAREGIMLGGFTADTAGLYYDGTFGQKLEEAKATLVEKI